MSQSLPSSLLSTPELPGWRVSFAQRRNQIAPHGNPAPNAQRHHEKKGKKAALEPIRPYNNPKMDPWQHAFARAINAGHNAIVSAVTSTGKTWAAVMIAAHEVLERDDATALVISPNSVVLRETTDDIGKGHQKYYTRGSMMSTMTRNYQTYDPQRRGGPPGQLMIITADSAVNFMVDPLNKNFIDKLHIIVFDEVHMPTVTDALWWSQYIPHTAQIILLSATLGEPERAKEIVDALQGHDPRRPQTTTIFTQDVRPVPLQYLTYMGVPCPTDGVRDTSLKGRAAFSCLINPYDPTRRDLQSMLGPDAVIPSERQAQFELGRSLLDSHQGVVCAKNREAVANAVTDPTPENIYGVLCSLMAKDMAPVMVFHPTTDHAKKAAVAMMDYITTLENQDLQCCQAKSLKESYDTAMYRARDDANKKIKTTKAQKEKKKEGGRDAQKKSKKESEWNKPPEDTANGIDLMQVESAINKWRFQCDFKLTNTRNVEQWIQDALSYGIGVYVNSMGTWLQHMVFDAVRNGHIKVLYTDHSIAVGVNLPIRTVVTCGIMPHELFLQAGGRAGRRGMDDRGYIVEMMPKEYIEKYTSQKMPDVRLKMPASMPYTSFIRLMVPANLSSAMEPDITGMRPSEAQQAYDAAFDVSSAASPVDPYHVEILSNYMRTLTEDGLRKCHEMMALIRREQWHYHRLTNLIKMIPEDNSILLIKLMVTGGLKELTTQEVLNLLAMILFRIEPTSEDESRPETMKHFYVPDFRQSRLPNLRTTLQTWANTYGLNVDFSRPIHRYIIDYVYGGQLDVKYIKVLDDFREWMYILKNNVQRCAPAPGKGYVDATSEAIYKADKVIMAADHRKDMKGVMDST